MNDPKTTGPTVKANPTFKAGDTVYCKSTKEKFEVLKVVKGGALQCKGRAGLMPASAAMKELPPEDDSDEE